MLNDLAEAAQRGVQVTIITNESPAISLRLHWQFEEKWWGAVGKCVGAGFTARVFDKDGDASEWIVTRGKEVIAEGETFECTPYYHFDACLLEAEAALMGAVRERLQAVKKRRQP